MLRQLYEIIYNYPTESLESFPQVLLIRKISYIFVYIISEKRIFSYMAQPVSKAAQQFIDSGFFRTAVRTGDFTEVLHELNKFIECYHKNLCIQSTKIYGKLRECTDQVIKPYLRNQDLVDVDYYPKAATMKDKLGRD